MPNADGIVIAMNRMNRILEVDPIDRIAIVEPGAINTAVTKAVERFGLHLLRILLVNKYVPSAGTWPLMPVGLTA